MKGDLNLSGFVFTPIGKITPDFCPFSGTFEGNGHTISNLNITGDSYIGLFGYAADAVINNLTLKNTQIFGHNIVGGLSGFMRDSYVNNCSMRDVFVEGRSIVGGLTGAVLSVNNKSQIRNCSIFGQVEGQSIVGGLIGSAAVDEGVESECKITDCFASCTVGGKIEYVGGLVGGLDGQISVIHSFTAGNVIGNLFTGGLIGVLYNGSVESCVALNDKIVGDNYNTGRICGFNKNGTLSNNSAWNEMKINDLTVNGTQDNLNGQNVSNSAIWSKLDNWRSVFGSENISVDGPTIWHIDVQDNPWGIPYLTSQGIPSPEDAENIQYLKPDTPGPTPSPTVTPKPHRGGGGGGTTIITSQTLMPTATPTSTVTPTGNPTQPTKVSPSAVPTVPATQQQQSPMPIIGILSGLAVGGFLLTRLRK